MGGRFLRNECGVSVWKLAHAVPGALDRGAQIGEVGGGRVVGHGGALRSQVDARRDDAGDLCHAFSTRRTQEAQVIPSIGRTASSASGSGASSGPYPLVDTGDAGSVATTGSTGRSAAS